MGSKWAKLQKRYKVLLAAFAMIALGSGGTLGVMAAIPHSTTGVISACRNTITGSLKAIDAQAGATCGGFETLLSWPSAQPIVPRTAYARLTNDPVNGGNMVDPSNSKNIISSLRVATGGPGDRAYFCFKATFNPKIVLVHTASIQLTVEKILGIDGATAASIASLCNGGDYNVVVATWEGSETGPVYMTE